MLDFSYFANGLPQDAAGRLLSGAGRGPALGFGGGSHWGVLPGAVGTGGNGALPGGALFLGRNRGKNTKGKEVPSPWNPILWWEERGKWFRQVGAWPAASKTNASWPAHQLGRAGEVVY